jgi:hypothetical protein
VPVPDFGAVFVPVPVPDFGAVFVSDFDPFKSVPELRWFEITCILVPGLSLVILPSLNPRFVLKKSIIFSLHKIKNTTNPSISQPILLCIFKYISFIDLLKLYVFTIMTKSI